MPLPSGPITRLLCFLTVHWISLGGWAPEARADAEDEFLAARDRLAARDYGEASRRFEALRTSATGTPIGNRSELLLARARLLGGQADRCAEGLVRFLESRPEDPWATRARLLLADAWFALGRHQDASDIYRERLEFLRGDTWLTKISSYWLEIADTAYEGVEVENPGATTQKPTRKTDFPAALEFYQKARRTFLPEDRRDEVHYRIGHLHLELGNPGEAIDELRRLLGLDREEEGATPRLELSAELRGQALRRLGLAQSAAGESEAAIVTLERLVEEQPKHALSPDALWHVVRLHEMIAARTTSADTGLTAEGSASIRSAIAASERFLERYAKHEFAPEVARRRAALLVVEGRPDRAVEALDQLTATWPKSQAAPTARLEIADIERRRENFDRAIAAWRTFLGTYPNHPKWTQAQQSIIGAKYQKGVWLWKTHKDVDAARATWNEFLAEHPLATEARQIWIRLHEIELPADALDHAFERPRLTDDAKAKAAFLRSLEPLRSLWGKYQGTPEAAWARLRAALILQNRLDELEPAIAELEALIRHEPGSREAGQARAILQGLRAKHLKLVTPRATTSTGEWSVDVETRNISELRFKAYRLNVEEYFRAKCHLQRIEDVIVGVVEPTHTWTEKTEDYREFRLSSGTRTLEIDAREVGAYILTVEDASPPALGRDAAATPLLATTLLLRTDLAFVTKHSSTGSLIWAIDERSGEPRPGVRVLLADAKGVFQEGITDEQGVWIHRYEKVEDARPDLRVLAVEAASDALEGTHYAADAIRARQVASYGYTTKVHIATDRPVYRPNQRVQFRGILRKASAGRYESSEGETALVQVENPYGVLLFDEKLEASAFGTISGEVALDGEPPLGEYSVRVRYRDLDFDASFWVEEYRKPEYTVRFEPERTTWLPGETVSGRVSAEYLFGAPVAGAEIQWQVWSSPFRFDRSRFEDFAWFFQKREDEAEKPAGAEYLTDGSGTTDAEGRLDLRFDPPPGASDRVYTVVLQATDISRVSVGGVGSAIVSREGIFVVARADRRVYRPGDSARVTFRTVDAGSRPVDARGDLVVLRRRGSADQLRALEKVVERPLATEEGSADASVTLAEPGEYEVVFRTRDRGDTTCSGGVVIQVAGETPDLAREARLLAEKAVYRQGEKARLFLDSPVVDRHALLTFEGADVIAYEVLRVSERSAELEVEMADSYSPNVHIAVSIPADNQLYEAHDEVIVLQYLDVELSASKPVAAPGEEVEIELRARDQEGQPVEAELSLAVVDASIFELRPDATPAIKPHFYDQRRPRGVASHSSYSFRYAGTTRAVDAAIFEERSERVYRMQLEKKEAVTLRRLQEGTEDELLVENEAPAQAESAFGRVGGGAEGRGRSSRSRRGSKKAAADKAKSVAKRPGALFDSVSAADAEEDADSIREFAVPELQVPAGEAGAWGGRVTGGFSDFGLGGGGAGSPLIEPKVRRRFADTAHWQSAVRTGADGRARVRLTLPDNLTRWRVRSIGTTQGTHFGEGETSLRTSKGLLVRAQTPRFLTRADRTEVRTPVHNYLDKVADVSVSLEGEGIEASSSSKGQLRVPSGEVRAAEWTLTPPPASATTNAGGLLRLAARTTVESDALEHTIPIVPFGKRESGGAGGLLIDRVVHDYEVPADLIPGAVDLEVSVYPQVNDLLLDASLWLRDYPYGCVEQTVSGFLPLIAVAEAQDRLGSPRPDLRRLLDRLVPKRIVRLLNLQRPSGGWGWWGRQSPGSTTRMTALALIGLERARLAGYRVQTDRLEKARNRMLQLVGSEKRRELTALALWALSFSKKAPQAQTEQLVRYRDELSVPALGWLVLAQKNSGNATVSTGLAEVIRRRARPLESLEGRRSRRAPLICGRHPIAKRADNVAATAWALAALEAVDPDGATNRLLAEGLLELRIGREWATTESSAAAITALGRHFGNRARSVEGTARILVDGREVDSRQWSNATSNERPQTLQVRVPPERLAPGRRRVELVWEGTGEVAWALRHEHWRQADEIAAEGNLLRLTRRLENYDDSALPPARPQAALRVDPRSDPRDILVGYAVPSRLAGDEAQWLESDRAPRPGFNVLERSKRPARTPKHVRTSKPGEKLLARLEVVAREAVSHVILESPIPAGCEVVADADERFSGPFDRREVHDNRVTFFATRLAKGKHVFTYVLRATFPGDYHVLPGLAQCMYEPAIAGTSADARLSIRDADAEDRPEGQPSTPDERLYRAEFTLRALLNGDRKNRELGDLREEYLALAKLDGLRGPYRDLILGRLAALDLRLGRMRTALERVEELRRHNSRLLNGVGDLDALAEAYGAVGEPVQRVAYQKRVLDAYYRRDQEVTSTLFDRGQKLRAQVFGLQIAADYPESNRTISDSFQLSRRWAAIATERRIGPRVEAVPLHAEAVRHLSSFTAFYPKSPLAPQASYLIIQSLQGLAERGAILEQADKFATRYPEHELLDDSLHAALVAAYDNEDYDRVVEQAPALFERKFPDRRGRRRESSFADNARFLLAKTSHIRGDLDRAVELYREVASSLPEAAASLAHLTSAQLSSPSVVTSRLDEKPALRVRWKNVGKVRRKIYRIDLQLLFAVRKDLRALNTVDLTGIDPIENSEVDLGEAAFHSHERDLELPVEEKGAYLVSLTPLPGASGKTTVTGTSTILLRSDLRLDVERREQIVRVHVEPRGPASVKISDGKAIVAKGMSDARGIWEAPVVGTRSSVLVERDGHFALYNEGGDD